MVNHYHLMIETPDANLSKGMQHLNATFSQAFNKRHATVGHLFQGRFKAIVVDRESYLLELALEQLPCHSGSSGFGGVQIPDNVLASWPVWR